MGAAYLIALSPQAFTDASVLQVLDAALSAQTVGLVTQEQYKRKLAQLQEEGVPTEAPGQCLLLVCHLSWAHVTMRVCQAQLLLAHRLAKSFCWLWGGLCSCRMG